MRKTIHTFMAIALLSLISIQSQAQMYISLKNQKKYEREHRPGSMVKKKPKKSEFRFLGPDAPVKDNGTIEYNKAIKKEKRKTSRIANRQIRHPKFNARIKEKDKVGA
ncbi:MAG: hypothetical protein ACJ75J_08130 [Cytophagaceae bacterium]|jgi:hypothetical protein